MVKIFVLNNTFAAPVYTLSTLYSYYLYCARTLPEPHSFFAHTMFNHTRFIPLYIFTSTSLCRLFTTDTLPIPYSYFAHTMLDHTRLYLSFLFIFATAEVLWQAK